MKESKGHLMVQRLRKEFGIPEESSTPEEDDYERRYRKARARRIEEAGYIDRYTELFNRDYWTDEWLGPGPDPGYQYMEEAPKNAKISDKEIERKQWEEKYARPNLPKFELGVPKESKAIKKARKARKKKESRASRQKKYDLAYWLLEIYFTPEYSRELYLEYVDDLEGLVDFAYDYAVSWLDYTGRNDHHKKYDIDDIMARSEYRTKERDDVVIDDHGMKFKSLEVSEKKRRHYNVDWHKDHCPDIPDEYWKEFDKWCKNHPLKDYYKQARKLNRGETAAIGLRRIDFLKKINRRNKGFQKHIMKSGINLFDPMTGKSFISEKKMKSYMERRMQKYDEKRKEFVKLLDGMVEKGQISEDMAISWMSDTKEARERVERRYKEMRKRIKEGQKKYGRRTDDLEHDKEYMKQRDAFFKKFKADPKKTPAFTIKFAGEATKASHVDNNIWKFERADGRTDYKEFN